MILALVVLALTQVPMAPQAPQAPPRDAGPVVEGAGTIRGRVVADDTGEPVRGCRVMLIRGALPFGPQRDPHPQMGEPGFVRTNQEGRYEFTRLAPGSYRVLAAPEMSNARYVSPWPRSEAARSRPPRARPAVMTSSCSATACGSADSASPRT
jgi:protocatechuate 3,4-dioxygenase beta subunit